MKNQLLILLALLFTFTLSAQDKTIDLSSYNSVHVSEGIKVTMIKGDPKAEITMHKGKLEDVVVSQDGESIRIKFKKKKKISWNSSNNRKVSIDLYFDGDISEVAVSSGALLQSDETFFSSNFECDASSGGTIDVRVESDDADISVSSGASIKISGEAKNLEVSVSSGATFKGKNLKSKSVDVDASSGASATVWATDDIEADTSSGASIKYKGDPKNENLDAGKWSGGSIRKL